jgi:hypothetical protein
MRVMNLCSLINGYHNIKGTYCLHLQEYEGRDSMSSELQQHVVWWRATTILEEHLDTMNSGTWLSSFQRNMLPPYSGRWRLKHCVPPGVWNHPPYNPEDHNLNLHHSDELWIPTICWDILCCKDASYRMKPFVSSTDIQNCTLQCPGN